MRKGIVAALTFGLFTVGQAMAQDMNNLPANEMSSVEWRDCAGHFYFLSRNLSGEAGGSPSPEDKKLVERMGMMGAMAVYAGESKAAVEARAGKKAPLGLSLTNPQSGQLEFDVQSYVTRHTAMAVSEGKQAYVPRYAQICGGPVNAFTQRFLEAMGKS